MMDLCQRWEVLVVAAEGVPRLLTDFLGGMTGATTAGRKKVLPPLALLLLPLEAARRHMWK